MPPAAGRPAGAIEGGASKCGIEGGGIVQVHVSVQLRTLKFQFSCARSNDCEHILCTALWLGFRV